MLILLYNLFLKSDEEKTKDLTATVNKTKIPLEVVYSCHLPLSSNKQMYPKIH